MLKLHWLVIHLSSQMDNSPSWSSSLVVTSDSCVWWQSSSNASVIVLLEQSWCKQFIFTKRLAWPLLELGACVAHTSCFSQQSKDCNHNISNQMLRSEPMLNLTVMKNISNSPHDLKWLFNPKVIDLPAINFGVWHCQTSLLTFLNEPSDVLFAKFANTTSRKPSSVRSTRKRCFTSMWGVLWLLVAFSTIKIAPMLSTWTVIGVLTGMPCELWICTTKMISFANSLKAMSSASAVDKATMLACSEHHRMGIPHTHKASWSKAKLHFLLINKGHATSYFEVCCTPLISVNHQKIVIMMS